MDNDLEEGAGKAIDPNRAIYESEGGHRTHSVNLERVQRIHLGIDNEAMAFSAETIADMLTDVAERCNDDEAFVIRAVVNALRGDDAYHGLVLKQKKQGRFLNPTLSEQRQTRRMKWLWWLAAREEAGIKTESAIAEIATNEGVGRATVFSEIRKAEAYLQMGRDIFGDGADFDNPRPAK